jgi:thioesterase domain-containing protein
MQAKGADGVEEPFDCIEDLAEYHIDAIREVQPHGPYFLIGYSLGGLVVLEMAQRLTEAGEKIALLVLLETYPHARYLSTIERARLATRITRNRASTVRRLPIRDALSYLIRPSTRGLSAARTSNANSADKVSAGVFVTPTMQHARDNAYTALTRYRPRFYSGAIKFVRAETVTDFPEEPAVVWSGLAGRFQVETVPGDHLGILGTHFETLASVISRYIQEASA